MNLRNEATEAWRGLLRKPGFLLRATCTLAAGVAASTLLFSLVAGTLLTPPAVPAPDKLVMLHRAGDIEASLGQPDIADLRAGVPELEAAGILWSGYAFDAVFGGRPLRIEGAVVDKGYLDAVAAAPLLGRYFSDAEDGPAAPRVAIVSERLWRTRFNGEASLLGRTLQLNGLPFEVIGVAPAALDVLHRGTDLWAPAAVAGDWVYKARGSGVFDGIARVRADASLAQANASLDAVSRRLAEEYPRSNAGKLLVGTPIQDFNNASAQGLLWVLLAATLVLLLVGVVNVMSLLLVRGVARQQEYAMRRALGAGRARLVRVTMLEGAFVGAACALFGGALAWIAQGAVLAFARSALPAHANAALDLRVLAFAAGVAVGAGVLAALAPALRMGRADARASRRMHASARSAYFAVEAEAEGVANAVRTSAAARTAGLASASDMSEAATAATTSNTSKPPRVQATTSLMHGGARMTSSRSLRQWLDGLMAAEIALACALAIGALLLLRSLAGLAAVELGFRPDGVLGAELVLPDSRYDTLEKQSLAVERTVQELARKPGVTRAAFVVGAPLRPDCCIGHNIVIEGRQFADGQQPGARVRPVLGDYFGALGIALVEGRGISDTDDRAAARVAVVNRRFAQRHFPGESALGKRIAWRPGDVTPIEQGPQWMSIVGVVEDVKSASLREEDASAIYFPYLQRDQEWIRFGTLLARVEGQPMAYADAMQSALSVVDPLIPLQDARSLTQRAADALAPERFAAGLASAFGVLALALALQGVAAVLGFGVAQRRAELGIRAALGADASRLRALLLGQGLKAAIAGVGLGLAIALAASHALDALVFGVSARDASSYAAVAVSLALFALLAAWWPARRAARIAPAEALRHP